MFYLYLRRLAIELQIVIPNKKLAFMPGLVRFSPLLVSTLVGTFAFAGAFWGRNTVYLDEIGYLLLYGRFFQENGHVISLYPQCSINFLSVPPFAFTPFLAGVSVLHDYVFTSLRAVHLVGAAIGGIVVAAFTYVFLAIHQSRNSLCDIFPIFLWWVVGSYMLFVSLLRPEQMLALLIAAAFLLSIRTQQRVDAGKPSAELRNVLILITIFLIACAIHPKSVFFVPFFLVSISLSVRSRTARAGLVLVLGMCFAGTIMFAINSPLKGCAANSIFSKAIGQYVNPSQTFQLLLENPISTLTKAGASTLTVLTTLTPNYFNNLTLTPSGPLWTTKATLLSSLIVAMFLMIVIALLLSLAHVLSSWKRFTSPLGLMFVTLWLGLTSLTILYQKKFFYEDILYVPLLFLLLHIGKRLTLPGSAFNQLQQLVNVLLLGVALLSSLQFRMLSNLSRDYGLTFMDSSLFVSLQDDRDAERLRPQILESCFNNRPIRSLTRIVLSEDTYLPFRETREPFMLSYVTGFWAQDIQNLSHFLLEQQSDGVIVSCARMPAIFVPTSTAFGSVCCINRDRIAEAAIPRQ